MAIGKQGFSVITYRSTIASVLKLHQHRDILNLNNQWTAQVSWVGKPFVIKDNWYQQKYIYYDTSHLDKELYHIALGKML